MSAKTLVALAVLKANWDHDKKSYLDNFVPFGVAVLEDHQAGAGLEVIQAGLKDLLGVDLPRGVVATILNRAARQGYVKKGQRQYAPVADRIDLSGFRSRTGDALRREQALVRALVEYAATRHSLELVHDKAERLLLSYVERSTVPILRSAISGKAYEAPSESPEVDDYVVSKFVLEVTGEHPELFDSLLAIVQGSMLASALFYAPSVGEITARFERTTIYFDTPIILRALGYEGAAEETAANEVIRLAKSLGARVACFDRTLAELRRVLYGVAEALGSPRRKTSGGPVRTHFLEQRYRPSDVELLIARLEDALSKIGLNVVDRPQQTLMLGLDEEKLGQLLRARVQYKHNVAMLHDLDALTAVYRLRGGNSQPRLERCRAIFITSNSGVSETSQRYFSEELDGSTWPLVMLDHVFATMLWLKQPIDASELPSKQLLANCYAALTPRRELWRRYVDEADRLLERGAVSEEDHTVLKFSLEASALLQEHTMGSPERVSENMVLEILSQVKTKMGSEARGEERTIRLRAEEVAQQSERAREAAEIAIEAERLRAEASESRVSELELVLLEIQVASQRRARRLSLLVGAAAALILVAIFLLAVWAALPTPLGVDWKAVPFRWRGLAKLAVGVAILVTFAFALVGHDPRRTAINLRNRYERRLLARWSSRTIKR